MVTRLLTCGTLRRDSKRPDDRSGKAIRCTGAAKSSGIEMDNLSSPPRDRGQWGSGNEGQVLTTPRKKLANHSEWPLRRTSLASRLDPVHYIDKDPFFPATRRNVVNSMHHLNSKRACHAQLAIAEKVNCQDLSPSCSPSCSKLFDCK